MINWFIISISLTENINYSTMEKYIAIRINSISITKYIYFSSINRNIITSITTTTWGEWTWTWAWTGLS